jgi:hypothetical protein
VESVTCPGCQKPIRVPDEVLGQTAKCPFCKCHFHAPVRTPEGLTDPVLVRRNPFGESRTFGPGMALVFVGLLGVLTNAVKVGKIFADREAFAQQVREDFDRSPFQEYTEPTIRWMPFVRLGFLGLSGLVVAAGVALLARRWHGLAMIGAAAALFNVANYCCFLGFPAGAWALFVLRDPTVRAQFNVQRPAAPTP